MNEKLTVVDGDQLMSSIVEIGLSLQTFGLEAENIVEDGCLQNVIYGTQVEFCAIAHRQDLPVAAAIF